MNKKETTLTEKPTENGDCTNLVASYSAELHRTYHEDEVHRTGQEAGNKDSGQEGDHLDQPLVFLGHDALSSRLGCKVKLRGCLGAPSTK